VLTDESVEGRLFSGAFKNPLPPRRRRRRRRVGRDRRMISGSACNNDFSPLFFLFFPDGKFRIRRLTSWAFPSLVALLAPARVRVMSRATILLGRDIRSLIYQLSHGTRMLFRSDAAVIDMRSLTRKRLQCKAACRFVSSRASARVTSDYFAA
jgi:hypothetical protein